MSLDEMRMLFAAFTDPEGLLQQHIHPAPNDTGNGLMLTSEKIIIYAKKKTLQAFDRSAYTLLLERHQRAPGLFVRSKTNGAQESQDDLTAIITACRHLRMGAQLFFIETFLRANHWLYTDKNWRKMSVKEIWSAWLGRFLALRAHLHLARHTDPGIFLRLVWIWALWRCRDPRQQDPWRLAWHRIEVYEMHVGKAHWLDPLMKWAVLDWRRRFRAAYPGGMRELEARYQGNAGHPLALYWEE